MIRLLPHEEVRASLSGTGYEVALTDWRIVARGESFGATLEQVIPLECVDSTFVGTSRHNSLLYLGGGAFVGAVVTSSMGLVSMAAVLLGLWWILAKRGAQIFSRSGMTVIVIQSSGTDGEGFVQFMDALQDSLRPSDR